MKITFFVSGSVRSNFSYRILALSQSLHKLGHDVAIVAPKADKYNDFTPENIEAINGVRILQPFQFTTRRLEINLLPYIFGAIKILFHERPNLIYVYKATPISIVGLLGKLFLKTPVVADFDDLGSEVMKIEGHPVHQRKLVELSERLSAWYSDRLVVASGFLFDHYKQKFPAKPIYLLPNGVDSEWFKTPLLPPRQKTVVFMGAMNRTSILEPLFDVFPNILKSVPDAKALIIGDGKFLSYFKEKCSTLKLDKNITFTGWLDIAKARANLHEGDIGYSYMPIERTIKAASNMKVSQYMSRGVIPLVSDISDLSEVADFQKAAYIAQANDLKALEGILLHALKDSDWAKKAKNAHEFSQKEFNWDTLASGFDQWISSKKTSGKPKVYVVATTVPDDTGGEEMRNYNLVKQLVKNINADVEVFCISPRDRKADQNKLESDTQARYHITGNNKRTTLTVLRAILIGRVPPFMEDFKESGVGDIFRKSCEEAMPDFVQLGNLTAYYCVRSHISWLKKNGVKIIFDCHNIEFQSFRKSLELFPLSKQIAGKYLTPGLNHLEIEAVKSADVVFACSAHDAGFFKQYNTETHVVPNGVDFSSYTVASDKNRSPVLIFLGGVGYPPNSDGMEFYLKSVQPLIKEKIADVKLLAIGMNPNWLTEKGIQDASVEPLGFVKDVRPYLNKAIVGICPIRHGSGTRIKIMTYMAAGLAVVSTKKGAEGVAYKADRDIFIADEAAQFADRVVTLLTDNNLREKMAENGRTFVSQNYDWNVIGKKLQSLYSIA